MYLLEQGVEMDPDEALESAVLTAKQVKRHLVALRKEFGITDQEFLQRVQRGEMGHGASEMCWLILLKRADLIPRRSQKETNG